MVTIHKVLEAVRNDAARLDKKYDTYAFSNSVDNIGWSEAWADERSDTPKGIAYANWNDIGGYGERAEKYEPRDRKLMGRLCAVLEKLGVEIEWCDQVSTCDGCGLLVQTRPDSYGWQPEFVVGDGEITCSKCLEDNAEDYLQELEGDESKSCVCTVDPADYGYVKVQDDLQRGFHPGQDADPRVIAKSLRKRGVERFLFQVDDVGQFDCSFSVWVHEDEAGKLGAKVKVVGSGSGQHKVWECDEPLSPSEVNGPSVSGALERGLKKHRASSISANNLNVRPLHLVQSGCSKRIGKPRR